MDTLYANPLTAHEYPELELNGYDGPYLSVQDNSVHLLQVNQRGDIQMEILDRDAHLFKCVVENEDRDTFEFSLDHHNSFSRKKSRFEQASNIMVVSDIEGNFDALYSLLIANGVMSTDFKWIFDDGHLVILGDLM